jgi:hypothetical protein
MLGLLRLWLGCCSVGRRPWMCCLPVLSLRSGSLLLGRLGLPLLLLFFLQAGLWWVR